MGTGRCRTSRVCIRAGGPLPYPFWNRVIGLPRRSNRGCHRCYRDL